MTAVRDGLRRAKVASLKIPPAARYVSAVSKHRKPQGFITAATAAEGVRKWTYM
jgi:hypothetical protein